MTPDCLALALELRGRREAFALATVVRAVPPTSAKPGAKAIIRADGSLTGWVGGACAEPTVVREALAALRDGRPRLLRLVGDLSRPEAGPAEGVREYPMSCHGGGTLEIYVEPELPRPELVLVGHGPVLQTLAALARAADFEVRELTPAAVGELAARGLTPRASIVVATHGPDDEPALEAALRTPAGYVSLVASRRRAAAIAAGLARRGLPVERIGTLKAPAGLDLGAVTPAEIAVSILAEIIQVHRAAKPGEEAAGAPGPGPAVDPVCGMAVDPATARYRLDTAAGPVFFCGAACQERFAETGR